MPREIVFRLNGGGDTPLGPVDVPPVVVVVVTVPLPDPSWCRCRCRRAVPAGDTSGEKIAPSAYSDRFRP